MASQTTIKSLVLSYKSGNITIKLRGEQITLPVWDFVLALKKIGIQRIPKNSDECPMD